MVTIFSTPKPFRGHEAIIQKNAIKSWTLLRPQCEVILFGDDEGAAEVAEEFNIRYEPNVRRNERGVKFLNDIFDQAQRMARHEIVCYVNCDIILMSDFVLAVQKVASWKNRFLMVGRRWDVDIVNPWDFGHASWENDLRDMARTKGLQRTPDWIDYFVFHRGMLQDIPSFLIGRVRWDNWLIWRVRSFNIPVVDCSSTVTVIHQNHGYSYHPAGKEGVWYGEEAKQNLELAGGNEHLYQICDSTHKLGDNGFRRNLGAYFRIEFRARMAILKCKAWLKSFGWRIVEWTRPLRHAVGIRKRS